MHLLHEGEIERMVNNEQLKCVEQDTYLQFLTQIVFSAEGHRDAAGARERMLSEEAETHQQWNYSANLHDVVLDLDVLKHYGCHSKNAEGKHERYNPMASLMLQAGSDAAIVLFKSGMPKLIPAGECALAFIVFSLLACWCAHPLQK